MSKKLSWVLPAIITFIFITTLSIPFLAFTYQNFTDNILSVSPSLIITAHTGCENTQNNSLESIVKGIESGAACVEFDVRFLNDGTPVLSHDEKGKEESVKLDSALNLLYSYKVYVNLDLKETSFVKNVADLISFYKLEDRCFFTGITEDKVSIIKTYAPKVSFFLNTKITKSQKSDKSYLLGLGKKVKELGAVGINVKHTNINKQCVDIFHSQNLLVSVYTVNSNLDINLALSKNVDNITTLRPTKAVSLISRFSFSACYRVHFG